MKRVEGREISNRITHAARERGVIACSLFKVLTFSPFNLPLPSPLQQGRDGLATSITGVFEQWSTSYARLLEEQEELIVSYRSPIFNILARIEKRETVVAIKIRQFHVPMFHLDKDDLTAHLSF